MLAFFKCNYASNLFIDSKRVEPLQRTGKVDGAEERSDDPPKNPRQKVRVSEVEPRLGQPDV